MVLKESSNAPLHQDPYQWLSVLFCIFIIKFGSLMTEKSFRLYTDLWKSSSFVWSLPLAEFLMYMLSLSCSLPAWLYK